MWCTQSFAKDDTIGRVRWGVDPQVTTAGWEAPGRLCPASAPLFCRSRVSTDLSPTCLVIWSLGTPQVPEDFRPLTMPTCSVVSGPWPRRVSRTDGPGRGKWGGEEGYSQPASPPVHTSLSSVLAALTNERDRLRDLHQGSELPRLGVRLGGLGNGGRRGQFGELRLTHGDHSDLPCRPHRSLRLPLAQGASILFPFPRTPLWTPSAP